MMEDIRRNCTVRSDSGGQLMCRTRAFSSEAPKKLLLRKAVRDLVKAMHRKEMIWRHPMGKDHREGRGPKCLPVCPEPTSVIWTKPSHWSQNKESGCGCNPSNVTGVMALHCLKKSVGLVPLWLPCMCSSSQGDRLLLVVDGRDTHRAWALWLNFESLWEEGNMWLLHSLR